MSDKLLETIESEPLLRIERIGNHVDEVLKKDSISCIAVHCKFLAIGTCSGKIHIVDHQGNCVQERLSQVCLVGIIMRPYNKYKSSNQINIIPKAYHCR